MIAHKNIIKDVGRLVFWFPVRWCINMMSFRAVYTFGTFLGILDYYISGRSCVEKMKKNIMQTLGYSKDKASMIVLQSLQNHSRNVMELIKYPQINKKNFSENVELKGIEYLDSALKKGNGVIMLTGHFGAKQILQVAFGLLGYPLIQLNYHMESEELSWVQKNVSQKYRLQIEDKIPVRFISSKGSLMSAVKALKRNEILLIAGDGIGIKEHMSKGYKSFPFLGRTMLFPAGSVGMAKFTKAALLPVFAMRNKHRHKIIIESPIDAELETDDALRKYIRILEKYVYLEPSMWEFWEEFEQGLLIE
ncbi:hypothetical protein MTBBW1_2200049 [Desulfamplus magnetovallimortis]|uniref:Lipid A biosynthesis acyltransferase n=1 Tax=Desulfamplus magnetovallimortis TaxID=1246637 RepID=A0A1W1HDE4_9BACT|nr:lysophospholipid acyltransferase family protein [Desulfamplus magnetovallimortis]SLM30395.1 hypothetical protein MTBBW1_2200049 [Desulfamplus magnetovallimortis]